MAEDIEVKQEYVSLAKQGVTVILAVAFIWIVTDWSKAIMNEMAEDRRMIQQHLVELRQSADTLASEIKEENDRRDKLLQTISSNQRILSEIMFIIRENQPAGPIRVPPEDRDMSGGTGPMGDKKNDGHAETLSYLERVP